MAENKVDNESELGRVKEELQGVIKRTDCIVKELQDQASSITKQLELLRSKLSKLPGIEAEISKISRIEIEISRINTEISNKKAEISKINADISNKKTDISKIQQQLTDEFASVEAKIGAIRSNVDSFEFKKAIEQIEGCIDKMNTTLVQASGVEERIDDMLNSLLSFSVQMSFGNNFFSFIVQYHSTCGNWLMVFGMIVAFLSFLGFPLWINWGMLENNFVTLEFHSEIVNALRSKARNILEDNNLEDGDGELELPRAIQINEIRRKYVTKFVWIIMFVVIQCIVVSVGSHFLFCEKSLSSGPLLSISGLSMTA